MGTPGRPDDRFSETHRLQCYARAVTNYRRNFICGGSFFFTANLAERRLRLRLAACTGDFSCAQQA
jgi:hypothetical protein